MKIYEVEFKGVYPTNHGLIIAAKNKSQAKRMAMTIITHRQDEPIKINEIELDEPKVLYYASGDY
jgi:hypothetical protein